MNRFNNAWLSHAALLARTSSSKWESAMVDAHNAILHLGVICRIGLVSLVYNTTLKGTPRLLGLGSLISLDGASACVRSYSTASLNSLAGMTRWLWQRIWRSAAIIKRSRLHG